MMKILRKNHGSGEHRAGQRASSGFIAARFYKVCMKIAQKVWFIAHFAKIHNLFVLTKLIFEHCYDFVLCLDGFFERFHEFLKVGDTSFHDRDASSIF